MDNFQKNPSAILLGIKFKCAKIENDVRIDIMT